MKFRVSYTFGATILVDAEDEDAATEKVEQMPNDELFAYAKDGLEIQEVVEEEEDEEDEI